MADNTHLVKQEEAIDETGIQDRAADPVSPVAGQKWYNTTDNQLRNFNGSEIENMSGGGGGGGLNFYEKGDMETAVTGDFNKESNAIFGGGGGAFSGVHSISTDANDLIGKLKVSKWVGSATPADNLNDYVESEQILIDQGYEGREHQIKFQYKWNGSDDAMQWVVRNETTGDILSTTLLKQFANADNTSKEISFPLFIPKGAVLITMGPQCVDNTQESKVFIWDDVTIGPDINRFNLIEPSLKQYIGDTSGEVIVVTSSRAIAQVDRIVFIPYKTKDGAWRIIINGEVDTSSAFTNVGFSFSGFLCIQS